jgi:NAD-dependent deacetylase
MTATDSPAIQLARLLEASRRAVVFTGAGISTESGIPDFRGPGGLWTQMKPIQYQDYVASDDVRQESWRRRFENGGVLMTAKPNAGHDAVALLVSHGKVSAVITQNIDNLHQASGVPPEKVIELHGNGTYVKCLRCEARTELKDTETEYRTAGRVGPCRTCGGIVKTATISFGQQMPAIPMARAADETGRCDLFIVLGSSLSVFPAADFPAQACESGAKLVIVNHEPTDLDRAADLVINAGIGATLSEAVAVLGYSDQRTASCTLRSVADTGNPASTR